MEKWRDFLNLRNNPQRGKLNDPTPVGGRTCQPNSGMTGVATRFAGYENVSRT